MFSAFAPFLLYSTVSDGFILGANDRFFVNELNTHAVFPWPPLTSSTMHRL